jgi:peptidoglycan/LPS O-acetylase OafA/YrhL
MQKEKLNALTGLRFLASALIVFHHTGYIFPISNYFNEKLNTDYGVSFFYVLSGFILFYNYHGIKTFRQRIGFIIARIARIWPVHLATLIITLLAFSYPWGYWGEASDKLKLLSNIFLIHAWFPYGAYFFSFNGPSWSISVELFFYILFPFIILNFKENYIIKLTISIVFCLFIVMYSDTLSIPNFSYGNPNLGFATWLPMIFPPIRVPEFLIGMSFAHLWMSHKNSTSKHSIYYVNLTETIVLILSFLVLRYFQSIVSHIGVGVMTTRWLTNTGAAPFFGLLIYIFATGRGFISKIIGHRYLVFLGDISFSLYLIHELCARFIAQHLPIFFSKYYSTVWFLLFWGIILIFSAILYLVVEKPCRKKIISSYNSVSTKLQKEEVN